MWKLMNGVPWWVHQSNAIVKLLLIFSCWRKIFMKSKYCSTVNSDASMFMLFYLYSPVSVTWNWQYQLILLMIVHILFLSFRVGVLIIMTFFAAFCIHYILASELILYVKTVLG